MNMRIAAILLLGYCAGMSTPAFAQKKDKLKKGPNISLNISAKKDSVKTTYLNIGLLTNIYQLKGIGINAVSSVVQNDMTGFQISINLTDHQCRISIHLKKFDFQIDSCF